jgi:hypothetical protein
VANPWTLYQHQPSFVLGFHGTDRTVADQAVSREIKHLKKSEDTTEWLGHGVYFWENDPARALEWANYGKTKGTITLPDAVGAVIDLGFCLDLTTMTGLEEVESAFITLRDTYKLSGFALPKNTAGPDKIKRELDCAVIQALHLQRSERNLDPYDSVRAPFPEDKPLFDDSGFRKRNHIQICIIKPEKCIKGYFKPIPVSKSWG